MGYPPMKSNLTEDELARLEALAEKATPGPWVRQTVGHATVRKLAGKITRQLGVKLPSGAPASTDGTWVWNADETKTVAFIGNGPLQTENGDLIAALSPDVVLSLIAALRATPVAGTAGIDALQGYTVVVSSIPSLYRSWRDSPNDTADRLNRLLLEAAIKWVQAFQRAIGRDVDDFAEYAATLRTPKPEGDR